MRFEDYLASRNSLYTGRASSCIYLALTANQIVGAEVLLPANICYAAVFAVIHSGNVPVFADVGADGNLTDATVAAATARRPAAAIVPHMYGNPCLEIGRICETLRGRGAMVIEDCALAMGATIDGAVTGTFGDYAIFSFGYSKTIDCGYGGLIVSDRRLADLASLNDRLPTHNPGMDAELHVFSQIYRVLRNNPPGRLAEAVYDVVREQLRDCFVFAAPPDQVVRLSSSVATLDAVIRRRREAAARYDAGLQPTPSIERYPFHAGAVPWRYNILVEESLKPRLVAELLRQQIPVSDWYPVIAPMFRVAHQFPQASAMEKRLLNFPVAPVTADRIDSIMQAINIFVAAA